jgi:hypothetical protein
MSASTVNPRVNGISLAEFARRRGVSRAAVTQAIRAGRLRDSVGRAGTKPVIMDVDLADREWSAGRPAPPGVRLAEPEVTRMPSARSALDEAAAAGVPSVAVSRARFEAVRVAIATMELTLKRGELVPVEEARTAVAEKFVAVRTRLLGLPIRIRQRLPHLSAEDVRVIDALIRETLEELADGKTEEAR